MKTAEKRGIFALIASGALAAGVFGCPSSFPDVGPYASADGGGADGQIVPPGCDLTQDPKDSIACVDESIGLFVSASGSDSNAGTKASPLKTITAALGKLDGQHNRVYVCDGTYGEEVKVSAAVGIYGGFSCTSWAYDGTAGKVGPTAAGYALDIENVSAGVTIEDLEFDAQNGVNPGDSSIAIFAASSAVTLKRVKAVAGDGITGADAIVTSNYDVDGGDAAAPTGNSVDAGDIGALACVQACADKTSSIGGKGGDSNAAGANGGPVIPPYPDAAHDGEGAQSASGSCSTVAHGGATAASADGGAESAPNAGHITESGWATIQGSSGTTAGPGQGGGGGGGGSPPNGAGGSGGCGGCGGAGGAGGMSGGSTFAILSYQATWTFDTCILQAGNGGDGTVGGAGQAGQTGGFKGSAVPTVGTGCDGAPGGNGGAGAGGGGGAGGNAIAIGYVGAKPVTTGATMSEGTAGAFGAGGTGASGNNGLAGAAGTKADVQELP